MPGDDTQYVRVRDTVGGEGVAGMRLPVIRTVARRSGTHGRRAVDYLVRMPAGHHWWFRGEEVDVEHGRGRA